MSFFIVRVDCKKKINSWYLTYKLELIVILSSVKNVNHLNPLRKSPLTIKILRQNPSTVKILYKIPLTVNIPSQKSLLTVNISLLQTSSTINFLPEFINQEKGI